MPIKFRTELSPERLRGFISHKSRLLLLGSCFSDEIGLRLQHEGFDAVVNPCGTLYNPESIAMTLQNFIAAQQPQAFIESPDGMWHSFYHHSHLSANSRLQLEHNISKALAIGHDAAMHATHILVTFGTSYIFRHKQLDITVANCHKLPAAEFERYRLDVDHIVTVWDRLIRLILSVNPTAKVIFTVSPIRHLADGLHGNTISKSTLHLAVDRIIHANPQCALYFPAYEALVDDLRDYRFYAADLTHPSPVGADYVYDLFKNSYMDDATMHHAQLALKEWKRSAHRPITDTQNLSHNDL
ncbi:MAG: GSCFA domain-containing protein [Muribaculaceae bacterium]|nr:GSCFA domain-containing protein [Muribaculaceae bacterium]